MAKCISTFAIIEKMASDVRFNKIRLATDCEFYSTDTYESFFDNSIMKKWLFLWFVVQCKLKSRQKRKIELAKMQIISAVHVLF